MMLLSQRFVDTDAGRAGSRRPKQRNDCTVRTLALVTGAPYDVAYDYLARERGRKSWNGAHWPNNRADDFVDIDRPDAPGGHFVGAWSLAWRSYPAEKGRPRMNLERFVTEGDGTAGVWIAREAKHVLAVIDGRAFDDGRPDWLRCVYGAWKVEPL